MDPKWSEFHYQVTVQRASNSDLSKVFNQDQAYGYEAFTRTLSQHNQRVRDGRDEAGTLVCRLTGFDVKTDESRNYPAVALSVDGSYASVAKQFSRALGEDFENLEAGDALYSTVPEVLVDGKLTLLSTDTLTSLVADKLAAGQMHLNLSDELYAHHLLAKTGRHNSLSIAPQELIDTLVSNRSLFQSLTGPLSEMSPDKQEGYSQFVHWFEEFMEEHAEPVFSKSILEVNGLLEKLQSGDVQAIQTSLNTLFSDVTTTMMEDAFSSKRIANSTQAVKELPHAILSQFYQEEGEFILKREIYDQALKQVTPHRVEKETLKTSSLSVQELFQGVAQKMEDEELVVAFSDEAYAYHVLAEAGWTNPLTTAPQVLVDFIASKRSYLEVIDLTTFDAYYRKDVEMGQKESAAFLEDLNSLSPITFSTDFFSAADRVGFLTDELIPDRKEIDAFLKNLIAKTKDMMGSDLAVLEKVDPRFVTEKIPQDILSQLYEAKGRFDITPSLYQAILDTNLALAPEVAKTGSFAFDESLTMRDQVKEKALEFSQEQEKKTETKLEDFPDKQEAAPLPEATVSQPLNDLSPSQTRSQSFLYFSIEDERQSIHKDRYHPISDKDLPKLNRYAPTIQSTAQWYLDEVADTQIIYVYQEKADIASVTIDFGRDKFMHLTGIYPYREGQTAEQTLLDFAKGEGRFNNILLANKGAAFDKLKVLPELPAILEADSFYFGDLSDVPKLNRLDLSKAIKSGDEDVLLAMRSSDGTTYPASLMKLRKGLNLQLANSNEERVILGVYRDRDGVIDQLSINEDYIKDGGKELMDLVSNKAFEPVLVQEEAKEFDLEQASPLDDLEPPMDLDMPDPTDEFVPPTDFIEGLEAETVPDSDAPHLLKDEANATPTLNKESKVDESLSNILALKDTKALSQHLKEGIRHHVATNDNYRNYLDKMSQLNRYSDKNLRLLLGQNPDVQMVASFKKWKEEFGRTVKKGEKALRVFAPVTLFVPSRHPCGNKHQRW